MCGMCVRVVKSDEISGRRDVVIMIQSSLLDDFLADVERVE